MVRAMPVRHRGLPLAIAAIGLAGTGCYRVPDGKTAVSDVKIEGTREIDEDDLAERLATRESSRFLGLFPGVFFEYETFDRHALQRDLARIERFLRARGYYDAHVQAARVVANGNRVRIYVEIEQGPATVVESLFVHGATEDVREAIADDVKKVLPLGAPLDEDKLAEAERAALSALTRHGHAAAKVERSAEVDLATHKARITLEVTPGRVVVYGPVKFEGLDDRLPEDAVRRVFGVEEKARYDSSQLDEAKQALLDLGVFANVEIVVDKEEAERTGIAPVVVKCEVSKLRALLVGIGGEFDSLKADAHLVGGWQNSNFLGGLRKLDVRFKPGIVFYPTRLPDVPAPDHFLYEHRLNSTLRQPAFFEKRLTAVGFAEYSVYPVILPKATENVLGYHELKGEVGVERPFGRLFLAPRYGFQANFPFDYVGKTGDVDPLKISYVELNVAFDLRDNPQKPRKGIWLGGEIQNAGSILQGDADDVRMQPEAKGYIPLHKKVVLALRGSLGFLFPINYRDDTRQVAAGGSRTAATRDYQILFFRGFFGGGPTSNRGYPLRAIGPHDVIPFLSPAGQSGFAGGCDPTPGDNNVPPDCRLPTGGLSLWEANAEVRFVIVDAFSAATFCDSGDVSGRRVDFRFDRPHLSCGGGGRYDTPVGPVRLDVGVRIPGAQYSSPEDEEEPDPLFGLPIAISIAIGEAF
jgi:outer membrane protein assembly factor BamA